MQAAVSVSEMSNNASASFYQSANSSTSTLRPRNNRLISYDDDPTQTTIARATFTSASSTPRDSRRPSPPPSASDSRGASKARPQPGYQPNHKWNTSENADRRASSGIWESWPSIQGIASTLLGTDASTSSHSSRKGPIKRASSTDANKNNVSARMVQDKTYNLKQTQPEWGPRSQKESKPTSIEEQRALLQAKRREALLSQSIESSRDSLGRYKRKDSDASVRSPVENENDILVYRHKVQPNDTMAGVVIKYSCQQEAFRRANRFWPNDNIQRRDWVVLPVDACSIRGRKTDGPYIEGLDSPSHSRSRTLGQAASINGANDADLNQPFPPANAPPPPPTEEDSEFKHECWVLLPSQPQPVEILRISKRALGYFPPARRKSPSRSQPSTPFEDSSSSTPKTSFDMLRHPPSHAAQQAAQAQLSQQLATGLNFDASPGRGSSIPRYLTDSSRSRSSSSASASHGLSHTAFTTALSGPGGVGTLRGLRTERARPGPAEDSLNKKFAQYMPEYLPPDHPDYAGSDKLRPPSGRSASTSLSPSMNASLRATPRASMDSIRSTRSNSSSMPAAIVGWMGKVGSPMRKKADLRLERNDMGIALSGIGEADADADLIELADTPDEVSKQLHDEVDERTPIATPSIALSGAGGSDEELMNDRFPVRGRIKKAYEAD